MPSGDAFVGSVRDDGPSRSCSVEAIVVARSATRVRVDGYLEIVGKESKKWMARVSHRIPRHLRKHFEAIDVFHEACCRAMERADSFYGANLKTFEGWFSRILFTTFLEVRRYWEQERHAVDPKTIDDLTDLEIIDPARSTPQADIERMETVEAVLRAIRELSFEYREVLRYRAIDDLPSEEVGSRLGIPPRRVWWVFSRVRAIVAGELKGLDSLPPPPQSLSQDS